MKSSRSQRRNLERDLLKKKNKVLVPEKLLYQIKYVLNVKQADRIILNLKLEDQVFIEGNPFPKKYGEIRKTGYTYFTENYSKELIWYERIIKKYAAEINKFLKLEQDFENFFLKAEYNKAREILEVIEKEICVSYWSLEKKLLLAEYENGFKKNKEQLTELLSDQNDAVIEVLARYYSIRVEKNFSHLQYEEIINSYLDAYKDDNIREYLLFKLNFYSKQKYNKKSSFLYMESNASIIDRYKMLLYCSILTVSETQELRGEIESTLAVAFELSKVIEDNTLINILLSKGIEICKENLNINLNLIEIFDDYTAGNYKSAIEKTKSYLLNNPSYFELYETYIKSCIYTETEFTNIFPTGSPAEKCLTDMYNILRKTDETANSLINYYKTYNSFGFTSWAYKIYAYLNFEYSISSTDVYFFKLSHIYSNYLNPILSILLNEKKHSLHFLTYFDKNSNTIEFWKRVNEAILKNNEVNFENLKISPYRKAFYTNKVKQINLKYQEAIDIFKELQSDNSFTKENSFTFNREEINSSIINCLYHLRSYKDAMILITESNIIFPNGTNKNRNEYFLRIINTTDDEEIISDISCPILLHQYQSNTNDIWIAYDNFLNFYGLNYPHDLINIKDIFPKDKLIYFLKNVCKQEVYNSSYMFEDQDDLDNERIEVCLNLAQIDEANLKLYINEISEISRAQLIRKGIKQIDESKIYVDEKGVRNSLQKELKESFQRSLNLLNLPLDQIQKLDENTENIIVPFYGKSSETNKIEAKEDNIKIASYSRFEQFADMFIKIRDRFIASNEYGIETYLSMRIRHGTLLGEIRSVFENHQLITKKESDSNDYQDNPYWINKLYKLDEFRLEEFNKIMAEFSLEADKIPDELKNKTLQIKTEKKLSNGLFDYTYNQNALLDLFSEKLGGVENYDEFFDSTVDELWIRTEDNLSKIRHYISNSVKQRTIRLLADLQEKLEKSINKYDFPELNELIRNITSCQTAITTEFEKIANWFKRTKSRTINEFFIDLPLDASLTTIKRIYPKFSNFTPKVINEAKLKYEGEYFEKFTDLIQNLLDNIIKHSFLPSEELEVDILLTEKDNELTIKVINNISSEVDLKARNVKIEETRELIAQNYHSDLTRNEGGTGYPKIKKIIKSDLGREKFSIYLSNIGEDRTFRSEITFEINDLEKVQLEQV